MIPSQASIREGSTVTQQITPSTTPFAITIPRSKPRVKVMKQSAIKPAIVVRDEPATEVIVAAKSAEQTGDNRETVYEIADLAYHVMVLMTEAGISLADIHRELASRHVIDKKVKQEKMV